MQQLQWHSQRLLEASSKGREELFLIVSDAVLHRCCKEVEHTFILEDDQNTNFNIPNHAFCMKFQSCSKKIQRLN